MIRTFRYALTLALIAAPGAGQSCPPQLLLQGFASDAGLQDRVGFSVDVSADTVVLGNPFHGQLGGRSGSAYVFVQDPIAGWSEVQELLASDGAPGDHLGEGVAIDGDTIVLGAPWDDVGANRTGSAYLFERGPGGSFLEVKKLIAFDPQNDDFYGTAVELAGDTVLVGSHRDDAGGFEAGSVYVYGRDVGAAGNWGLVKKLQASDPGASRYFGISISVHEDTLAIGASGGYGVGAAYVFERDLGGPNAWGQVAKVVSTDLEPADFFGSSVSLWGNAVLVGAPGEDEQGDSAGACYAFERDQGGAGAWGQTAKLTGDGASYERFGGALSLRGTTVLIAGRPDAVSGFYVLERIAASYWSEAARENTSIWTSSGSCTALSALTAVVGGSGTPGGKGNIYQLVSQMPPTVYCTAGVSGAGCSPSLTVQGKASASAPSGFDVVASGAEGQRDGVYFFGTSGRQAAPWNNSFQCVVPPVRRGTALSGGGSQGLCDGTFVYDLNARWTSVPAQRPGVGDLVQIQLWMRDPTGAGYPKMVFSDAVETVVCP